MLIYPTAWKKASTKFELKTSDVSQTRRTLSETLQGELQHYLPLR
jgi:hypothetical protein